MNHKLMKTGLLILAAACLLLVAADTAATPDLSWYAFTGGGGHSSAGIYSLDSATGQPFASLNSNGTSSLCSGFLCGTGSANGTGLYLPLVGR